MQNRMKQRIGIVQYDIEWCNWEANRTALLDILSADSHQPEEIDVVVLPEMFMTGFVTDAAMVAKYADATLLFMREMAERLDAAVVGSVVVSEGEDYRNRMYFVKPTGEVEWYDKRHLFSIGGEAERFTAGNVRKVVEWRGVRYLLEVCYDLRFPVWSRQRGDYDVIIYSALWPKPRRDVWRTLLQARAIENQAYVIGVNRVGCEPELEYAGDSAVIDYRGRAAIELGDRVEVAFVELDMEALQAFRNKFNVSADADCFEIKICQ